MKTAFVSVHNTQNLLSLVSHLIHKGIKIYAQGKTYDLLHDSFIVHKAEPKRIDLLICNLDFSKHDMIYAQIQKAAQHYEHIAILTNPYQYDEFIEKLYGNNIDEVYRHQLAGSALHHLIEYNIAAYSRLSDEYVYRSYKKVKEGVYSHDMPFTCMCGDYTYDHVVNALKAWNLVLDLKKTMGSQICCASFSYEYPQGVAIGSTPIESLERVLDCDPVTNFIATSDHVDGSFSLALRRAKCQGIIAPSFSRIALRNLQKRGLVLLKGKIPTHESKEFYDISGLTIAKTYRHNTNHKLPTVDAIIADTTLRHTTRPVAFAAAGQCVVGDSVRDAGQKLKVLLLKKERQLHFVGEYTEQEKKEEIESWILEGEAFTKEEANHILDNYNVIMVTKDDCIETSWAKKCSVNVGFSLIDP